MIPRVDLNTAPPVQPPRAPTARGINIGYRGHPCRAGRQGTALHLGLIAKSAKRVFRSQPREKRALRRTFRLTLSAWLSSAPCVVAKRCAAQIFASSQHWVQGSPLPPTAQVILPSCRARRPRATRSNENGLNTECRAQPCRAGDSSSIAAAVATVEKMKPGDLILMRGTSPLSLEIMKATGGRFSHVAIVVCSKAPADPSDGIVIEAIMPRVVTRPFHDSVWELTTGKSGRTRRWPTISDGAS